MSALKASVPNDPTNKPDFRARFMAWWNGHELPGASPGSGFVPPSGADGHDVRYEGPNLQWETARLKLAQEVWGEGFCTPGGAEHILEMVKFFALDPSMSVLDLGAGLGGASRVMAKEFGVWVTGLEANKELAEAGDALSTKAGLGNKAPVKHFDPATFEQKQKSIDCIFSKESFFTIADKPEFLRMVESALKPRGQLLFTDYVLAGRALTSKALDRWAEFEPVTPLPWAAEDYQEALEALHLDIRIVEDHTEQFHGLVTRAWADYIEVLAKRGIEAEEGAALVAEVELWARRVQAIEAGDLKVCRIHALKRDTDRLMSSW